MKKLAILGSTGSIGTSALKVVDHLKQDLSVVGLAALSNWKQMAAQVRKYRPSVVALYDSKAAATLRECNLDCEVLEGLEGIRAVACLDSAEMVLSAISGTKGLQPTLDAIYAGKDIALANKETLVSGGALVMDAVKKYNVNFVPVDSEHSALFQCLQGENPKEIQRLILTASGGPFRSYSSSALDQITPELALGHPTWNMGPKITVDSSTLMNKGLEVIEAHWLFGISPDKIDVVVHPTSVVHSLVEFQDGSLLAQLGQTDMAIPIQYALTYPKRKKGFLQPFDLVQASPLEFYPPDPVQFRCLGLAIEALREGGSMPCYMNAANEVLVHRFLSKKIGWKEIATRLETLLSKHNKTELKTVDQALAIDDLARCDAEVI